MGLRTNSPRVPLCNSPIFTNVLVAAIPEMSQTMEVQQNDANSTRASEEVDKKEQTKSRRPPSEMRRLSMHTGQRGTRFG